jgi:hypothetical protein
VAIEDRLRGRFREPLWGAAAGDREDALTEQRQQTPLTQRHLERTTLDHLDQFLSLTCERRSRVRASAAQCTSMSCGVVSGLTPSGSARQA